MRTRSLLMAALALGAFVAATPSASYAADGCGPGRFYNGYRCASRRGPPPPPVYRGYREDYGSRGYRRGPPAPCRPGFSVQDGVCKPYTGR